MVASSRGRVRRFRQRVAGWCDDHRLSRCHQNAGRSAAGERPQRRAGEGGDQRGMGVDHVDAGGAHELPQPAEPTGSTSQAAVEAHGRHPEGGQVCG